MTVSVLAKSLTVLFLAGALLAGCGTERVHSMYFIVDFLAGTPTPSQQGVEALANAVARATRAKPRFIAVDGTEPADTNQPGLEKQRADAIFAAFTKEGLDTAIIRVDIRPAGEKSFAERKDGFVIQLGYGEAPSP
ncbi:MAG TPA: hypothetical protein VN802_16835 [Stellaceae bacterium]|nr:hypothetical protein [Stellaceae bacterium]